MGGTQATPPTLPLTWHMVAPPHQLQQLPQRLPPAIMMRAMQLVPMAGTVPCLLLLHPPLSAQGMHPHPQGPCWGTRRLSSAGSCHPTALCPVLATPS
jgi:hypothetical protein